MNDLAYKQEDNVGIITINRPQALNALNSEVVSELTTLLRELSVLHLRCLIITGSGEKSFVAGADISEMKDMTAVEAKQFSEAGNIMMQLVEEFPIPVIAAVNGFALGGGCELALSCDIRVCSENAVFALPEVSLGILPGYGGVQRLSRTIGLGLAKELAFTTRQVKAEEAQRIGLVNKVVPQSELMGEVLKLAQKISSNAPVGVRAVKKVANASVGLSLKEMVGLEIPLFSECFTTTDQKEGMTAFLEKRKHEPYTGE